MKHILTDKNGRVALAESFSDLGRTELVGYTDAPIEASDKEWVKLKRNMRDHDISIDSKHNTIKSIKRKEPKQ